jgi:hypothetical protein
VSQAAPRADAAPAGPQELEGWAGEVRVNLVRLAALLAFYGYHLLNTFVARDPGVSGAYHLSVTALAMVWSAGAAALHFLLSRRRPPPALAYWATAWDIVLVAVLVMLAGGPKSPLVVLYFLVIAAAPPRLSLPAVYAATLGSVAAYLFLLGHYAFYAVGYDRYYASPELRVPRTQEAVLVLALLGAGVLAGQAVRQARRLARGGPGAAGVAGPTADERRRAMRGVAAGLLGMAALVGLGLLLPVLGVGAGRGSGEGPSWPALGLLAAAFLAAVGASVVEAARSEGRP